MEKEIRISTITANPSVSIPVSRRNLLTAYFETLAKDPDPLFSLCSDIQTLMPHIESTFPPPVHHALRRISVGKNEQPHHIVSYSTPSGDLVLDERYQRALSPFLPGEKIHLTPIQTKILAILLTNPQHVLNPQEAYYAIYNHENPTKQPFDLKAHIRFLRHKLGEDIQTNKRLIYTIAGGYSLSTERDLAAQKFRRVLSSPTESPRCTEEPIHVMEIAVADNQIIRYDSHAKLAFSPFTDPPYTPIHLSPTEDCIFMLLARDKTIVSASKIADRIYLDTGRPMGNESVKSHIRHLRQKLGDNDPRKESLIIHNIAGAGYSLMSLERRVAYLQKAIPG